MHLHHPMEPAEESTILPAANELAAELYQRYAAHLLSYLHRRLPTLQDAEDVLLESFLTVLQHTQNVQKLPEEKRRAWLWTVAYHRVADYYRRSQRRSSVSLEYLTEEVEDQARTPEQTILHAEREAQIQQWMDQLPGQQQEILALRFTGGLSCAEIAAILHKREGAIRTALSRSLNTLRQMSREQERE